MGAQDIVTDPAFWSQREVFLTGNTGFKGGWLATWLLEMGCRVTGYSLAPAEGPSYFSQTGLSARMDTHFGDIRDGASLKAAMRKSRPDIVFHLAAQPLVRLSYQEPVDTFATNVMGTINLLEAVRETPSVKAVVVVTSDKCYENSGRTEGYREADPMGGADPYSASKGCAELVCSSYRSSFLAKAGIGLATARAGNVIGGGDYSADRILPDAVRSIQGGHGLKIRNPSSVRPWQHVLDPLTGYLELGRRLFADPRAFSEGWNFGPAQSGAVPVSDLVGRVFEAWGAGRWESVAQADAPHEAAYLTLDSGKARQRLDWTPALSLDQGIRLAVEWYRRAGEGASASELYALSAEQIRTYATLGLEEGIK